MFGTLIVKHLLRHRVRVVFPRVGPCQFSDLLAGEIAANPTFSRSFLSNLLAITINSMYNPKIKHTTNRTTKFLLRSAENTLSKSIGFGATRKSLANEVR